MNSLTKLWALITGVSILILTPCFWQQRLIAGDMSSHAYNAWLAGEIREGRAPGMSIVSIWTNVLTDWGLDRLSGDVGSELATKLIAGSAVLVFFWGAFFLLHSISSRRPWALCPLLGILTYGVIFHLGFLNFYLSVGLCLWILGLLWHPSPRTLACAVPLVMLAILAHALPIAWAAAVLGYRHAFHNLPASKRFLLPILSILGLIVSQQVLLRTFESRWSWSQVGLTGFAGADQAWIYDNKYLAIAASLLVCMVMIFLERARHRSFSADPALHIWILHLAAGVLIPAAIQFPQYQNALAYIPLRISLLTAISFCIMVSEIRPSRGVTRVLAVVAVAFFACLYLDSAALNRAETDVARIVHEAPAGARVVAMVIDEGARVNGLAHVADRACIGHCFSYANYEPATAQFRIRVTGESGGAAAPTMQAVREMERSEHIVTPVEAPLHAVCPCEKDAATLCLRRLDAGERTCVSTRMVTFRLLR